jgi:hypothetical protein
MTMLRIGKFMLLLTIPLVFVVLPAGAQDDATEEVPEIMLDEETGLPMVTEEEHQMDWFIGEWDVQSRLLMDADADEWLEETVTSTVTPMIGGHALLETFSGTYGGDPLEGMSVRTYNATIGKWEQRWTDTGGGGFAQYTGEWTDDTGEFIAYSNRSFVPEADGGPGEDIGVREIFYNIEQDRFSWRFERTTDGGDTWNVIWELEYTRQM